MTDQEIMQLARNVGMAVLEVGVSFTVVANGEEMQRFATMVAEREREACAKVCESAYTNGDGAEGWLKIAAEKIRARTDSTVKQSLTVADAVAAEREACLAEIETGIWFDMPTKEVLYSISAAIRARGEVQG